MITGRFTLPVSIIVTLLCWVTVYAFFPGIQEDGVTHTFWKMITAHPIPVWANKAICFVVYIITGYLLIQMNNTFSLIRARVSVQTSFYLLFIATCPAMQILNPGSLATLTFVAALYLLFSCYQRSRSSGYIFHAFLFVGLGSLVFPQITLFAPVLLIGASNFQTLTPRSFFAALIGWSLPYWFLFGYAFYYDNMDLLYQPFIELATFYPVSFDAFQPWEIATLGFALILFMVSSIHCAVQSYLDKIRTRIYLRFLILLVFCIFVFILLQPIHCISLLPLLLAGVSILTCHMFVLAKNKISNVFFVFINVVFILLFSFNLWMLL